MKGWERRGVGEGCTVSGGGGGDASRWGKEGGDLGEK
jgi:hypothetical protein